MEAQVQQIAGQLQQVVNENQQLQQQVQQLQQQLQQQAQQQQQQQQQQQGGMLQQNAQAQANAVRDAKKAIGNLRKYDPTLEAWRTWEDHWRSWSAMNADPLIVGHNFMKLAIYLSMKGQASERVRMYREGTPEFAAATTEQYLTLFRQVFQPQQETEASRIEYKSYLQDSTQDIASYISTKISLWMNAYEDGHRSFSTLLDDAIEGMRCVIIQRIVRRANPANEEELRNCAIQAVANERWLYSKGKSEATSLDGLASVTLNFVRKDDRMEIDGISGVTCYQCGHAGHRRNECRTKPSNYKNKDKPQGKGGAARKATKEDKCFHCGKNGHFKRDCYSNQKNTKNNKDGKKDFKKEGAKNMEEEQAENSFLEQVDDMEPDT